MPKFQPIGDQSYLTRINGVRVRVSAAGYRTGAKRWCAEAVTVNNRRLVAIQPLAAEVFEYGRSRRQAVSAITKLIG